MTTKDRKRMQTLIRFADENGMRAANEKAARDAEKILNADKLRSRARILRSEGYGYLAEHFESRLQWLQAQGVA